VKSRFLRYSVSAMGRNLSEKRPARAIGSGVIAATPKMADPGLPQ
jgi:hypothetical protein